MYVIYSGMEERLCQMPESKLLNQSINQSNLQKQSTKARNYNALRCNFRAFIFQNFPWVYPSPPNFILLTPPLIGYIIRVFDCSILRALPHRSFWQPACSWLGTENKSVKSVPYHIYSIVEFGVGAEPESRQQT